MVSRLLITASVGVMVLAGACGRETSAPERPASRSTESPTAIPTSEPTHTPAAIIGPNEAWVHYDAAIRIEPGIPLAFYVRGNALYGLGQFQLAIRDYDKALRLDPRFVLGDLIRGLALNELTSTCRPSRTTTRPSTCPPTSRTPSSDAHWPTPLSATTPKLNRIQTGPLSLAPTESRWKQG